MAHYYDLDPSLRSKERVIEFEIKGIKVTLFTDNGVFSKSKLDEGSRIMLDTLLPLHLTGKILDIGAGYGPIGLTIAISSNTASVTLADINPRAVALCKKNAEFLGLSQRVTCLQSDVFSSIEGPYDSIVCNPPIRAGKKVTYAIYEGAYQHLTYGGTFYFVIRKAQGASSASQYVKEVFGNITLLARSKGYHIYKAEKIAN